AAGGMKITPSAPEKPKAIRRYRDVTGRAQTLLVHLPPPVHPPAGAVYGRPRRRISDCWSGSRSIREGLGNLPARLPRPGSKRPCKWSQRLVVRIASG